MSIFMMLIVTLGCRAFTSINDGSVEELSAELSIHFIYSGNMRGDIEPCG